MPTASEPYVCEECKTWTLASSVPAPLGYEGSWKQTVHAVTDRGYTRVLDRVAAPLMLGFNQAKLLARRRPEDKRTRIGYTRSRAQHAGSGRALGRREAGERRRRVLRQGPVVG